MYKIPIDDLLENTQTKDAQTKLENETTNNILGKIEQFFIVAVALLSCTVPVAGLILNIALCVYCFVKKIKLNPICWIIMLYCIIINISNLYTVLSIEIPSWGRGNIENIRYDKDALYKCILIISYILLTLRVFLLIIARTPVLAYFAKKGLLL